MHLKRINPGYGSSRGFQFPVSPVSVWGEAAPELEVGVKKLLCAGAAWIKRFFCSVSPARRGWEPFLGLWAQPGCCGRAGSCTGQCFTAGWSMRAGTGVGQQGGCTEQCREAVWLIPGLCSAREALEGRLFWGELISPEGEPQTAVSGGCWGAEPAPGVGFATAQPSALRRLWFEGGEQDSVGLNPLPLWEGAQMHSH